MISDSFCCLQPCKHFLPSPDRVNTRRVPLRSHNLNSDPTPKLRLKLKFDLTTCHILNPVIREYATSVGGSCLQQRQGCQAPDRARRLW